MGLENKKGFFFIVTVIVLFSAFILSYGIYSQVQERNALQKRIETLNDFSYQVDQDLKRQVYISGYRIIFSIEKNIIEKGAFISSLNSSVSELFFNGTLNGESQQIMEGASFQDISETLENNAAKINANMTLTDPQIALVQEDPWQIAVILTINTSLKDSTGLASWNTRKQIKSFVSVENFEDPTYSLNTQGLVTKKVKKTPYVYFAIGTNTSNLLDHLSNSYYVSDPDAPSFISRLQGNMQADPQGIESLVNIPELASQGIPAKNKSIVDHIYFSNPSPSVFFISGMPSWFRLDSNHLGIYNVSSLVY